MHTNGSNAYEMHTNRKERHGKNRRMEFTGGRELKSVLQLEMFGVSRISFTHFIVPYLPLKNNCFMTDLLPPQRGRSPKVGFGYWRNR